VYQEKPQYLIHPSERGHPFLQFISHEFLFPSYST